MAHMQKGWINVLVLKLGAHAHRLTGLWRRLGVLSTVYSRGCFTCFGDFGINPYVDVEVINVVCARVRTGLNFSTVT